MKNFFLIAFLCSAWVTSSPASSSYQCPHVDIENGRTRLRAKGRFIKFFCHEGFTLIGNKYSDCVKGKWESPQPVCASSNCPSLPKPENADVVPSYHGAVLMYFCESGYTLIGNSEIYCNGKHWNGTAPFCREKNVPPPTSCDFEKRDLCWWEQDPFHDFDWQRHNFETPSSKIGTGPTFDHTLGRGQGGHYLYIEASGKLANDTARINSPLYNGSYTHNGCFSFWYHMFGQTIGTLNVYFKPKNENSSKLMFTKSGDQGDEWHRGMFRLPVVETNFQLIIEGVRGQKYMSDIAIDDIAILQGEECNQTIETTVTDRTNGDLVEIVHASLTCRGKCTNSLLGTPPPPDLATDNCYCTIDCADYSLCCPDFVAYCLSDISTDIPDIVTTPSLISTSTLAPHDVPINRPDGIDPIVQKSSTMSTTTFIEVETPASTIKQKTEPDEEPECEQCYEVSDTGEIMHTTQHLHRQDVRLGMASIFGIVVGLLAAVTITAITAFVILHQRRSYKRGNSSSGLSEDSDVRFLTSDEALDFHIARPSSGDYDEI